MEFYSNQKTVKLLLMIQKITLFIASAICLIAMNTSAQDSRLTGHNTIRYNSGWGPYDTAAYVYKPGNNMPTSISTYNYVIKFDTCNRAGWNGTAYQPYLMVVKTYNNSGFCTLLMEYNVVTNVPANKTIFTLDGNNDALEELNQNWDGSNWINGNHTLKTFDGNHNALTTKTEYWNGTTWGSSYLTVYIYDVNNNMLSNASATYNSGTMQYDSTYKTEFFYNVNNMVDSSRSYTWSTGWLLGGHTINYYNINNINIGYLYQVADNGNWVNNNQGFSLLNGNIYVGDSSQVWNTTNNVWVNQGYGRHTLLNGNNLTMRYIYQVWNTTNNVWVDNFLDSTLYNTHDQPTWYKRISWDPINMTWGQTYNDKESHYYYEDYTANKVVNINKTAGDLLLYPVPAKSFINLQMDWNKAQDFTVGIYDIQGRLVNQWGEKATEKYNKRIPLNGLSAGTYILKIRGKDATVQEQFVIMD
jgi:hypothetical protein